ncbi:lysophospholipase [Paenibacillus oenotherae]|uniref:Lysophospholipase n=1 Tax=Paenibacillus oenotherae TaxID=1435645 RepID=A0ABS7D4B1_9BACL|nr:dienelactone hydrolase family protein [Paenibacillus oenotherae]MBW7474691.1 lysophospholipase [Paenibacillus oenotherae]
MSNQVIAAQRFGIDLGGGHFIHGEVKAVDDGTVKPVLVLSHGFKGHKDWGFWPEVSRRFAEEGFYTISYDFARIHARNEGQDERVVAAVSTVSREVRDIEAVVNAVRKGELPFANEADPERLAILGHSRSGSSSIIYAAEHPGVGAVVVWNGGSTPALPAGGNGEQLSYHDQAIIADIESNEARFDVANKFQSLSVPALLVQGTNDNERLLAHNKRLQEIAPDQHFVSIAGGDHTFGAVHPYEGATRELDEAFAETVQFLRTVY